MRNRGFCIDPDTRSVNELWEKIDGKRKRKGIRLSDLGEMLGMTGQNLGKKIKSGNFDYLELIKLFKILDFSQEEIIALMFRN